MAVKYYSVEQIAGMIDMHPKTIQRYIRTGKLRAQKIGKAWRVTGHDLSTFIEGTDSFPPSEALSGIQEIIMNADKSIRVSAIIDIPVKNNLEAIQIVNWVTALMNTGSDGDGYKSMNSQYIEPEHSVRILLWGSPSFIGAIMNSLAELNNHRGDE